MVRLRRRLGTPPTLFSGYQFGSLCLRYYSSVCNHIPANQTRLFAPLQEPPALCSNRAVWQFPRQGCWGRTLQHFFNDSALAIRPLAAAALCARRRETKAFLGRHRATRHLLRLPSVDPDSPICIGNRTVRQDDADHDRTILASRTRAEDRLLFLHDATSLAK